MLKNSFAPSSDPCSQAQSPGSVVFWPRFLGVLGLFCAAEQSDSDFFNSLMCCRKFTDSAYPYGMADPRPRDDRSAAQDLARELAEVTATLSSLKGEANTWLLAPDYDVLRHRLEDAHASSRRPPWRRGAG